MESWSKGHSGKRVCLDCGGLADVKPSASCNEPQHMNRYRTKLEKNNAYRRAKRAAARAAGTVDRTGRGNPENKAQYARRRHAEIRQEVFTKLGQSSCVNCGYSDVRALAIDHKNGGGSKHRRSVGSGTTYLRHLLSIPTVELQAELQVLCANCNAVKRDELEEWRVARPGSEAQD